MNTVRRLPKPMPTELRKVERDWLLRTARELQERLDNPPSERRPRAFQITGAHYLTNRLGALLADEMGVGKTYQALLAMPSDGRVLIVSPAVGIGVWQAEAAIARPDLRVTTLSGRGSFRWPETGEIALISYDVLPEPPEVKKPTGPEIPFGGPSENLPRSGEMVFGRAAATAPPPIAPTRISHVPPAPPFVTVVADEAHMLKSWKSRRRRSFFDVVTAARRSVGRCWLLSGSPMLNDPWELWSLLQVAGIESEAYCSKEIFLNVFRGHPMKFGGYKFAAEPYPEAHEGFARVALRREKDEVLADLPKKSWQDIPVALGKKIRIAKSIEAMDDGQLEAVLAAIAAEEARGNDPEKLPAFSEFSSARSALAEAKIPAAIELCEDYEAAGEPLVVFSAHRAPVLAIGNRPGWAFIVGDMKPAERSAIAKRFQAGELRGLAGTIQAMGVAITLTRASEALFVDWTFVPDINKQAEDRLHRMTQERPVLIRRLVADHALERRIAEITLRKQKLTAMTYRGASTGV